MSAIQDEMDERRRAEEAQRKLDVRIRQLRYLDRLRMVLAEAKTREQVLGWTAEVVVEALETMPVSGVRIVLDGSRVYRIDSPGYPCEDSDDKGVCMPGKDGGVSMSILVIDDDVKICQTLEKFLSARGQRVFVAHCGADGLELLRQEAIDIVITDCQMPGMDGFEVLKAVKQIAPEAETIMITGYGDMEKAVQAMRAGAFDFFNKPLDVSDLVAAMERTARFYNLRQEKNVYRDRLAHIQSESRETYGLSALVGESQAMRRVRQLIQDVSVSDSTSVLVEGETGTGKELVARAVHYESARAGGPFVAVDCTSIPEALFESELFANTSRSLP
ncbi:MAG: response regulator [bacterium]|nr:response regulator [bacterium]